MYHHHISSVYFITFSSDIRHTETRKKNVNALKPSLLGTLFGQGLTFRRNVMILRDSIQLVQRYQNRHSFMINMYLVQSPWIHLGFVQWYHLCKPFLIILPASIWNHRQVCHNTEVQATIDIRLQTINFLLKCSKLLFFKPIKGVRLLTFRNMNLSLFRSNSKSWFFCKASGLRA